MLVTVIFISIIFILTLAYLRGKYNEYYWNKRGVVIYKKHKTGGPHLQYALESRSFFQILSDIYNDNKNVPAVGLGSFFNKALYVTNINNMHHIYQVDFQSFYHRGIPITDTDLLANNIVFLNGHKWKLIRQKLSPLFTAAKLKKNYYIVDKSAQDFIEFLRNNPDKLKGNAHDTLTYFSITALTGAVFGFGTKSICDSSFRKMARQALEPTTLFNLKFIVGGLSAKLYEAMGIKLFGKYEHFFIDAIKQLIRHREKEDVKSHDFGDLCVQLQKGGTMHDPDTGFSLDPSDEVLAAQGFFFFLAGGEPSTATMFASLMELGRNPDILKRATKEVDAIFQKYNNQLTYDAVNEVEYLDQIFNETLRRHPPIAFISRQCTQDTVLPVGNIHIEKGVNIFMPVYELHNDPEYYVNPEVFDPERFSKGKTINDMVYTPFGKGNRYCIGIKYARLQILTGLMHVLRNYTPMTYVHEGGIKYKKEQNMLRLTNVDVEFVPRKE